MKYSFKCKKNGTYCIFSVQIAISTDEGTITLPKELKWNFIFYCNDCEILAALNNEVYMLKFNNKTFFL